MVAPRKREIAGILEAGGEKRAVTVVKARPCSLLVAFPEPGPPEAGTCYDRITLQNGERNLELSACRFDSYPDLPRRRRDDPPPDPGDGQLTFTSQVYDFTALFKDGRVLDLEQKVKQLPLLWNRRTNIKPAFREYTAELLYDLQVYRSVFDEIDRQVACESEAARRVVQQIVIDKEYGAFSRFLDAKLASLENETAAFSRQENELHGFFFRKQMWDIILSSAFMARTNLKPRGYAGDSVMMQMLYENEFFGETIFAKFMHRHPLQHPAARAVRNRREVVAAAVHGLPERTARGSADAPLNLMSVACGPAWELKMILRTAADVERFHFTLLDQDPSALKEAERTVAALEEHLGVPPQVQFVRGSVRTLHKALQAVGDIGKFDLVYSMGLFDYLTPPVARIVLRQLYDFVLPGGEMLIGNFHTENPSKKYMDYWLDWVLFYRSEEELSGLTRGLQGAASKVFFEEAGAQLFLEVGKGR